MKIGILVLFVNTYGIKGLYNSQEIGMAKELAKRGHHVSIFKCVHSSQKQVIEKLSDSITYHLEPVRNLGNNAITDFKWLDKSLDVLICCSDIQLLTSCVYRWCKNNSVIFIPYIGIAHSKSSSKYKRILVNLFAINAFITFRKTGVIVKNHDVKNELISKGINNIEVAPVGLDFDLLNADYLCTTRKELTVELGLEKEKKYILMVGRLAQDKNPLDVVTILSRLATTEPDVMLIIIGKGPLKETLQNELLSKGLSKSVIWIDQVNNSEMWKYYRIASALVSFSKSEIFGMSILEAMFYELPVYAISAPGPNDIIIPGQTGYLFETPVEMANSIILNTNDSIGKLAHQRVIDKFTWKHWADVIEKNIRIKRIARRNVQ